MLNAERLCLRDTAVCFEICTSLSGNPSADGKSCCPEMCLAACQAHEEVIQGLHSQVGQLETQKIFDDKALQALQVDLESACKSAQDAKRESTGLRKESSSLDRKYSKLQQELSSTTQVMAEARASNARVLQVSVLTWQACKSMHL